MENPKKLLSELNIRARKSLSQNFLISDHWANRLTDRALENNPNEIWEIGPGLGALTRQLVKKTSLPIRVFEYDKTLGPYLQKQFPSIEVIQGDFLKLDIDKDFPQAKRISLLSNLPYHISSPILFLLLEHRNRFLSLILTFQKELARRINAKPRTSTYGALSVLIQLNFHIHSLGTLSKGSFYPKPEIDSEVLTFKPNSQKTNPIISRVVHAAFAHRRKKLLNNLRLHFTQTPAALFENDLAKMDLAPNVRPQELTKEQFVQLTELIQGHFKDTSCGK